jgi:hypothetical protein
MNMMRKAFYMLMCAAALGSCQKDADIPPAPAVTYTNFYNGVSEYYGTSSLLLVNNDTLRTLAYNGVKADPLGLLNYANYETMHPGTYRVGYTDSSSGRQLLTDNIYTFERNKKQTIYLTDSTGYYLTMVTDDTVERDTSAPLIRLVHLSADAPKVSLIIDTAKITGIKEVGFRQQTKFIRVPMNVKPGIRLFYEKDGADVVIVRKSFPLEKGKCYTFVLRGAITPSDNNPNKTINMTAIINQ